MNERYLYTLNKNINQVFYNGCSYLHISAAEMNDK